MIVDWLDERIGIRRLAHEALGEPIPGGARLAYVFGSVLLILFAVQAISGICLALYYVPSADHAHTTVAYLVKEVSSGGFVRSLHAYGSSAMVVVLGLHVAQTILFGSYKGRRELLWLAGCGLLLLVLAMAFTGYLLPWDQKAYFATAVGTNILNEVPLIGGALQRLVRGGSEMGTLTLGRFFVAHVMVLPALIIAGMALHVFFFRKAGAAGPPAPARPEQMERFYPKQVLLDAVAGALVLLILGALAARIPAELGPEANPADTRYLPRPEWYYVPIFQWLKYWPGRWSTVGIVVIPGVLAVLFAGLPFFDRRPERRPARRPIVLGGATIVVLAIATLGYVSYAGDKNDPAIARQLRAQKAATEAYMAEPFQAESSAPPGQLAPAAPSPDPERAKGQALYGANACDACHGANGEGTDSGPALRGLASKYPDGELARVLRTPTKAMDAGGMSAVALSDPELNALIAFLNGVK